MHDFLIIKMRSRLRGSNPQERALQSLSLTSIATVIHQRSPCFVVDKQNTSAHDVSQRLASLTTGTYNTYSRASVQYKNISQLRKRVTSAYLSLFRKILTRVKLGSMSIIEFRQKKKGSAFDSASGFGCDT